jgi:thioredoxin
MKWLFRRQPKEKQLDRIMNVGDDDFKVQVLQRSYKMPVMVDFWASWCGPCRQLGPVLERVAEAEESGFVLAKLDTEANQKTAVQYRIQSIPAVKVFRNGQIVGEFVGGMPEANIRKFMDKIISAPPPSPHMKVAGKPAKRLQQAIHHLQKGRGFEAFVLLLDFPHSLQAETVQKLLPLARFLCDMDDGDGLTGNSTLDELYLDVVDKLLDRDPAAALAHLANALGEGTESQQARTKEVMSAILALLGDKHELSQQYLTLVA